MKTEDEKYRIKSRKKYARQVWSMDGKATIVDPLDPDKPEIENKHRRKMNPNPLKNLKPFRDRKPSER